MKKKRIVISVKKAAVLLSLICVVGVAGLALSIMLAPTPVRVVSAKETVASSPQISTQVVEEEPVSSVVQKEETEKPLPQTKPAATQAKKAVQTPPAKATTPAFITAQPASAASAVKTPQPSRAVPVSGRKDTPSVPGNSPLEPKSVKPDAAVPSIPETKQPPVQTVPAGSAGTLVFVFDDAGHNLAQLQKFLALPFPVTIAVLPSLPYSVQAAQQIRAAGKEVILHQPMQAKNLAMDPGPGAIKQGMNPGEIFKLVTENVGQIAPIAGMNNHEGSLITESEEQITAVLDVCRMEGIYFLDSRTTAQTAAPVAAAEKNMKIWERAIFLDNSKKRADMEQSLLDGLKIAEKKGLAILIGHVWSPELADLLRDWYPQLQSRGFACTTISALIRGNK